MSVGAQAVWWVVAAVGLLALATAGAGALEGASGATFWGLLLATVFVLGVGVTYLVMRRAPEPQPQPEPEPEPQPETEEADKNTEDDGNNGGNKGNNGNNGGNGGNNSGNGGNGGNGGNNNGGNNNGGSRCPDVSSRVLPACEMERRRPEGGRTYCPRGVCAEGLEPVPDFATAYMICVPKGESAESACSLD